MAIRDSRRTMSEAEIKLHRQAFNFLHSERAGTINHTWDMIETHFAPMRGGKFFQTQSTEAEITFHRPEVYSDVPISAADNLASTLHGSLTSSTLQWFEFRYRDTALNQNTKARAWLEDCSKRVWNALLDSNFDLEVGEAYLDLVHFGNAGLVLERDGDQFAFSTIPVRELYFTSDHRGRVLRLYRHHQWTSEQIFSRFGPAGCPDEIMDTLDDLGTKRDLIQAIYYRNETTAPGRAISRNKRAVAMDRPVGQCFFMRDSMAQVGPEGGYYSMPAVVGRWRKTSGSRWGYGPAALALPSAMTLNTLVALVLDNAERALSPPNLTTPHGLMSGLDLGPEGLTMVQDVDRSLKPYEHRGRFDVSALEVRKLEDQIRSLFLVDHLDLKESPAMTATEVSARVEKMSRILGAPLSRITAEVLTPTLELVFESMARNREFTKPPDIVSAASGYDVHLIGPLPRAMRRDVSNTMLGYLDAVSKYGESYPEIKLAIEPERFGRHLALNSGVPAAALRTEEEVKKEKAQAEKQKQELMDIERAKATKGNPNGQQPAGPAAPPQAAAVAGAPGGAG